MCFAQATSSLNVDPAGAQQPPRLHRGRPETGEDKAARVARFHGKEPEILVSSCGHAIHFSCFDAFLAGNKQYSDYSDVTTRNADMHILHHG